MSRTTITEKLHIDALLKLSRDYRRLDGFSLKNLIVLLRKRLRMSQRTLAKRAKIPASTLSRIESGKGKPSIKTIEKIFDALYCDFAILPIPRHELDLLVQQQIHRLAKKHVQYLKGTMALELQKPREDVLRAMIAREEKDLLAKETYDIWREGVESDRQ